VFVAIPKMLQVGPRHWTSVMHDTIGPYGTRQRDCCLDRSLETLRLLHHDGKDILLWSYAYADIGKR